jgi:hypothetical protein
LSAWLALGGDKGGTYSIQPLAQARGFPSDFAIEDGVWHPIKDIHVLPERSRGYFQQRDMRTLMGEWGFSYCLAYEILKAPTPKGRCCMSLPIDAYRRWDGTGAPEGGRLLPLHWKESPSYAAEHVSSPDRIDASTQFVAFETDHDLGPELAWFRELLAHLGDVHGEVRFVFGFA